MLASLLCVSRRAGRLAEEALELERRHLEEITVARSAAERAAGTLSPSSHARAEAALRFHGITILRGMFPADEVLAWAERARSDLRSAVAALADRGIDILNPVRLC